MPRSNPNDRHRHTEGGQEGQKGEWRSLRLVATISLRNACLKNALAKKNRRLWGTKKVQDTGLLCGLGYGILYNAGTVTAIPAGDREQDAADFRKGGGGRMRLYEAMDLFLQFLAVLVAFLALLVQYKQHS